MKRCSQCGEMNPLDQFGKDRSRKDGLCVYCKSCVRERGHRYYVANTEKVRENSRRWGTANPEKKREMGRRWYKANTEKAHENHRRWRAANTEKTREYKRRRYATNPEKTKESNRRWRAANPEKVRARNQRRRAKKRDLPHDLTDEQWQMTLETFNYRCAYCGKPPSQNNCPRRGHLVQEHLVALDSGGGYTFGNIVPACEQCNGSKGTREHHGWMERKGYDANKLQLHLERLVAA